MLGLWTERPVGLWNWPISYETTNFIDEGLVPCAMTVEA